MSEIKDIGGQVYAEAMRDPEMTKIISYPRTGSHWLRSLMEKYFERPILPRVLYNTDRTDYLAVHDHDTTPPYITPSKKEAYKRVLFLFRDPVDTVYSFYRMGYGHESDHMKDIRIGYLTREYSDFMQRWIEEDWTEQKTYIRYEQIAGHPFREFEKITNHFGYGSVDQPKLAEARNSIPKEETRRILKEKYPGVVNTSQEYQISKDQFKEKYGPLIEDLFFHAKKDLKELFEKTE